MTNSRSVQTSFGPLCVHVEDDAIVRLTWEIAQDQGENSLLKEAISQLKAYDLGTLKAFELPLRIKGSGFSKLYAPGCRPYLLDTRLHMARLPRRLVRPRRPSVAHVAEIPFLSLSRATALWALRG